MIGRANIEGWKSNVTMNASLPQASYPCGGNFSDTSCLKPLKTKGSIGHAFTVFIHTKNQNQVRFCTFVLHDISVLIGLTLGHLCYHLTDVPPQPKFQPDSVSDRNRPTNGALILENELWSLDLLNQISKKNHTSNGILLLYCCSHLFYTSYVFSQSQARVKLNRIFFLYQSHFLWL